MSLFVSMPGGMKIIGAKTLALTSLVWCLAPAVLGAVGLGLQMIGGGVGDSPSARAWEMMFHLLMLSPLISAPFWVTTGIGTALFCRHGICGSLTSLGWGALLGGAGALAAQAPGLIVLGAVMATFHRFTLAVLRPEAF